MAQQRMPLELVVVISASYFDQSLLWLEILALSNPGITVHLVLLGDQNPIPAAFRDVQKNLDLKVRFCPRQEPKPFWNRRLEIWRDLVQLRPQSLLLFSDCDNYIVGDLDFLHALFSSSDTIALFQPAVGRMPEAAIQAWGFCLCCGLVVLHAERVMRTTLLQDWLETVKVTADDQIAINQLLLSAQLMCRRGLFPLRGKLLSNYGEFGVFDYRVSSRGALVSCPMGPETVFWHVGLKHALHRMVNPYRKLRRFLRKSVRNRPAGMSFFLERH